MRQGESLMDILAVLGAIASIAGAVMSFRSAGEAVTAQEAAESARDQIRKRARHSDAVTLLHLANAALRAVEKYGPGAANMLSMGANAAADAQQVRDYLKALQENRGMFGVASPNPADLLYAKAIVLVETLTQGDTRDVRRNAGKELWELLTKFIHRHKAQRDLGANEVVVTKL